MIGLPKSRVVRMRYARPIQFSAASGMAYVAFKCNGLVDPSNLTGDHQPLGFDQWSPLYNGFIVIASRIRVSATTQSTTSNATVLGIRVTNTANAPSATTWEGLVEQGKSKYRIIQNAVNGNVIQRLSMGWSAKKWFSIKDWKDNQSEIGGTLAGGGTPADPQTSFTAHFQIFRCGVDTGSAVAVLDCVVVVDYLVALLEPAEINQS